MQRSSNFWFKDGSIVLKAGDVHFKVHQSLVERESGFFKDLWSLPQPDGELKQGSESNPLIVHDVEAGAFEALLTFVYVRLEPVKHARNESIGVLRAAHRYQFQRILAILESRIRRMLDSEPVESLKLAIECGSEGWQLDAFCAVALGFDNVAIPASLDSIIVGKIWQARYKVASLRLQGIVTKSGRHGLTHSGRHNHHLYAMQTSISCQVHFDRFVEIVSKTSRDKFLEAMGLPDCVDCRFTQTDLEKPIGPVDEERRIAEEIWYA